MSTNKPEESAPPQRQTPSDDYLYAELEADDGSTHLIRVDFLVWNTFRGAIPDGYYLDHIDGNLQNNALSNLRLLPPQHNPHNYLYVELEADDGTLHTHRVDYLVWTSFRGPIPEGFYIDHIDGDLQNNALANLRLLPR